MRRAALATALLVSLSLLSRWPIARHDLEHYIGPDEGEVVENVLEMVKTADFDPRHPGYPGLHFHLQRTLVELRLLFDGRTVPELPRSTFYLAARRLTLVAGAATALLVFAAGARFLPPWTALLAAALVALSPLAFRESAVVNPDLMLGFFVALALLFVLRLIERPSPGRHLAAGVAVGLATAVKYTGALTAVPLLAGSFLARGPRNVRWSLAALAAGIAAFALVSPHTFLDPEETLSGLGMHVGYYRASGSNGALDLLEILWSRGLTMAGAIAALAGALHAIVTRDRHRLALLGFPVAYLALFSFFDRAYGRHALPLLPPLALLAAGAAASLRPRALQAAAALVLVAAPAFFSYELWARTNRPSPADLAAEWARTEIPEGSRILQDQWTPSLDPRRFRVHRMRVEESVFPGNYDWVFYSGYPPGLSLSGLRQVRRFENRDALGTEIVVYQVPERESLMGTTLASGMREVEIGAGEPKYFGQGFDPPRPDAYGTGRLSRGGSSEIFFVLPETEEPQELEIQLAVGAALEGSEVTAAIELNGSQVGFLRLSRLELETTIVTAPPDRLRKGLNRLVLRYDRTNRLDRRHRETAIRFYRLRLTRC